MGYRNRNMLLDFSDLAEDGEEMNILIRNPKLLTADQLTPADVPNGPDGQPDDAQAKRAMYELVSSLIVDWKVCDPETDEPLPSPATPELVAKLPMAMLTEITKHLGEATNPK